MTLFTLCDHPQLLTLRFKAPISLSHAPLEPSTYCISDLAFKERKSNKRPIMAFLTNLPMELIQKIYAECPDLQSVINLSATSRRLRAAYQSSQKLNILEKALERDFGPLYDAKQLVTYNGSQPAQHPRDPPMSMALVRELAAVGYLVKRWEGIYPILRWRTAFENRRLLYPHEAFRFRRAMYRLWLYGKAFHNPTFVGLHYDEVRPGSRDRRLDFLRQFSDDALLELTELHDMLQTMVSDELCPSDATIHLLYREQFPEHGMPYFGCYETYPRFSSRYADLRYSMVAKVDSPSQLITEAWGSFPAQQNSVEEVMKLTPDQLLHCRENLSNRAERLAYLNSMPSVLHGRRSSLCSAIEALCTQRHYVIAHNHGIAGGILDEIGEEPDTRSPLWIGDLGEDGRGNEAEADDRDEEVDEDGYSLGIPDL